MEQGHRYKHKCKIIKNNEENKQIKIPQWLFNVTSHTVNGTLPVEFELQQPRQGLALLMHHLPINPSYTAIK